MSSGHSEVKAEGWISTCIVAFIISIINGYILIKEIQAREKEEASEKKETKWMNDDRKWLSLASIGCLIFGFLGNVFTVIYNVPGLCYVMGYLQAVCLWLQPACLIIYQFHQLYIINKEYVVEKGNIGRWVFIFLDIVGIIGALNIFLFPALFIQRNCGINEELCYYYKLDSKDIISIWFAVMIITVLLIEALGLFLYAFKLKSLRNSEDPQINAILGRIITLTVVNDIFAVLAGFTVSFLQAHEFEKTDNDAVLIVGLCIYTLAYLSPSIVVSNSMRLMMAHNTEDYVKFLKSLLKIKCICCCIRGDLDIQHKHWILEEDQEKTNNESNETGTAALTTKTSSRQGTDTIPLATNDTGDEGSRGHLHKGSCTHMKEISLIPGAPVCIPLRTNLTVN